MNKSKKSSKRPSQAKQGLHQRQTIAAGAMRNISLPAGKGSNYSNKDSTLRVTGLEIAKAIGSTTKTVEKVVFIPGSSGISRLDAYAKLFDLYRIKSCRVMFRSTCSSNTNGRMVLGCDYDASSVPNTTSQVDDLRPSVSTNTWQSSEIVINPERANKQYWLRTNQGQSNVEQAAFVASYYSTAPTDIIPGDIWIEYDLEFTSPKDPTTATAGLYANGFQQYIRRFGDGSDGNVSDRNRVTNITPARTGTSANWEGASAFIRKAAKYLVSGSSALESGTPTNSFAFNAWNFIKNACSVAGVPYVSLIDCPASGQGFAFLVDAVDYLLSNKSKNGQLYLLGSPTSAVLGDPGNSMCSVVIEELEESQVNTLEAQARALGRDMSAWDVVPGGLEEIIQP